jgi:iron complex outermembrane receptor protein
MKPIFRRHAVGVALLSLGSCAAFAQAVPAAPAAPSSGTLGEVTVTGNPLGATDLITPSTRLSGDTLLLRGKTTLGETLDGLPGVSSTYFGPNASRPVIRGLDGDRIRVLQNSGASIDASSLSYDHAVPTDPLAIESIEVLRGPGALLYGGSAVGGVVNVIDNRIPREPMQGVSGRADLGFASGNRERGGAALVEGGNERFALHADVFDRRTDDVRVPVLLPCSKPGSPALASRICNSESETRGGALGGTLFFDNGYLGASTSSYRSNYGTVAEDDVTIGMRQQRNAIEGALRNLSGPFQGLKAQFSHSDYTHTEFEGATPGTTFKNRGNDFRLEARQARWGNLDGVIGIQAESSRFSADGDEAFAPYSRTRSRALFAHEELGMPWGKFSFGARAESVTVQSLGNPDPALARFMPGSRDFKPFSYAGGVLFNVAPGWQITSNLAHTERAPKDYELFANGPHVATLAWETGDASLGKEKSNSIDVGAAWKDGPQRFSINAYASRFSNYIGLVNTGNSYGADGEFNPLDLDGDGVADGSGAEIFREQAYRGMRARFTGLEASGSVRLLDAASKVDLEMRGDLVRAVNSDTGAPLPRIAPARVGATVVWTQGPWSARLGFDRSAAQNKVPAGDQVTAAYTLWNAAASYRQKIGAAGVLWYARLDNLTNQLAYSATSILTSTAFGKAPLPGRSLKVGMRVDF